MLQEEIAIYILNSASQDVLIILGSKKRGMGQGLARRIKYKSLSFGFVRIADFLKLIHIYVNFAPNIKAFLLVDAPLFSRWT